MAPLIDRNTGEVHLAKEWVLTPGLSVESLANLIGSRLSGTDGRVRWFSHIPFSNQTLDLEMGLVFSGEALIGFKAQFKSNFRMKPSEVKVKQDEMLVRLLGTPSEEKFVVSSEIGRFFYGVIGQKWPKGAKELTWEFSWGRVTSIIEPKDTVPEFQVHWKPVLNIT